MKTFSTHVVVKIYPSSKTKCGNPKSSCRFMSGGNKEGWWCDIFQYPIIKFKRVRECLESETEVAEDDPIY